MTLQFSSDESGRFECALDDEAFAACSSPLTRTVAKGRHTWRVRAIDQAGNVDASPDAASFKVKRKRKQR